MPESITSADYPSPSQWLFKLDLVDSHGCRATLAVLTELTARGLGLLTRDFLIDASDYTPSGVVGTRLDVIRAVVPSKPHGLRLHAQRPACFKTIPADNTRRMDV